ncbi:MAG TPA: response regulator [Cyanobacteria bacterium UBA8803]|nr:response regulator [Cyanobacteria bacterium UBA9273]HBL61006.1 response regulator [Cyanobacteria bacterium UBA8803]
MSCDLAGLRLLVVDDNADSRELLKILFEQEGAEVMAVPSVSEALAILACCKPDILLCDILMPGEDGYSLIRKVRSLELERGRQIPAIAVTAAASSQDRQLALSAGFHRHISKPVNFDDLVTAVACLCERAR